MTKTKNERITTLENEVAELKLIVHELRGKKSIEPSTTTVEDIIEFEGQQYRKVDREACEGDVVIFNSKIYPHNAEPNKPYIVNRETSNVVGHHDENTICDMKFAIYNHAQTPETVDVYELIKQGLNPQIPIVDETIEPLTPNQQRAAIIGEAKKFVEENLKLLASYDFVESGNTLKLYSRRYYQDIKLTTTKCSPNDVFNEHIGKAIALGRALGLDVSVFEQAVQPTEFVVGQKVFYKSEHGESFSGIRTISGFNSANLPLSEERGGYMDERKLTILNDTNAIYGGVE